jgi:hypothetical protein
VRRFESGRPHQLKSGNKARALCLGLAAAPGLKCCFLAAFVLLLARNAEPLVEAEADHDNDGGQQEQRRVEHLIDVLLAHPDHRHKPLDEDSEAMLY